MPLRCGCSSRLESPRRALSADTPALMTITVEPAAVGEQLVRASLPFAAGRLRADETIVVRDRTSQTRASVRPLTWHHGDGQDATVRRGLTTFSYRFADRRPVTFELDAASADTGSERAFPARIEASNDRWDVIYRSGLTLQALPIWPKFAGSVGWKHETIESNEHFRWERWKRQSDQWTQIVEVRSDVLGQVVFVAHLQRRDVEGD